MALICTAGYSQETVLAAAGNGELAASSNDPAATPEKEQDEKTFTLSGSIDT